MKIIFIISSLKNKAGSERVATVLANYISQKHNVTVICREEGIAYPINEKVQVEVIEGNVFKWYQGLAAFLKNNESDLIVVHSMEKLGLLVSCVKGMKAPLWTYEHVSYDSNSWYIKILKRFFYKKIDKVLTLTNADLVSYKKFHKKVEVVNNPSPFRLQFEREKDGSNVIIAIGRLSYQKGFDLLVDAWALLGKRYPEWTLRIYGDGPDYLPLKQKIDILQYNNIDLCGPIDNVEKIYSEAAIYVMSSRYEGLPMVLIEAQSYGLPIVSFNCPHGPAEIVEHGVNGLLVESGSVAHLASSLEKLMLNKSLSKEFSANALRSAERFQIENIVRHWEQELLRSI